MRRSMLAGPGTLLGVLFALFNGSAAARAIDLVWEHPTPKEFPQAIIPDELSRPYLHVAMKNGGLLVLDVSDKSKPKEAARVGVDQFANLDVMYVTQRDEYLYLALGDFFHAAGAPAGLAVVHVKDPRRPKVLSVWKSKEKLHGCAVVVVAGNHAYLGAMTAGVMIFDVAKPHSIEHIATYQPDVHFPRKNPNKIQHPNARGLAIVGNRLYVAYDAGGLRVLDVSDKAHPKEIGRYVNKAMEKRQQAYNSVVIDKNLAYLPVDYAGLEVVDVSDPAAIRPVGWWNPWDAHTLKNTWFNSPGHTNQIVLDARKKLAYLSAGDSELQVVDVSSPKQPKLTASYGTPKNKLGVWGLAVSGDQVFLGYITAVIPFQGSWSGIKGVRLNQ